MRATPEKGRSDRRWRGGARKLLAEGARGAAADRKKAEIEQRGRGQRRPWPHNRARQKQSYKQDRGRLEYPRHVHVFERQRRQSAHHQDRHESHPAAVEEWIAEERDAALKMEEHRQKNQTGRGRGWNAREMVSRRVVFGFIALNVEARKANGAANTEHQRNRPTRTAALIKGPHVDEYARGDTEADEVR